MGLFTPVKKHANKFRYVPRYYDPEKERREQRRRELHGTSSETDNAEYQPGQYIRTQRDARHLSATRTRNEGGKKLPSMVLFMLLAALVVILYTLVPRIIEGFMTPQTTPEERMLQEYEEFNPYTPITIVPNDYKEE